MKSMCWDTRATDSIIRSSQKDTEASIFAISLKPLANFDVKLTSFLGEVKPGRNE